MVSARGTGSRSGYTSLPCTLRGSHSFARRQKGRRSLTCRGGLPHAGEAAQTTSSLEDGRKEGSRLSSRPAEIWRDAGDSNANFPQMDCGRRSLALGAAIAPHLFRQTHHTAGELVSPELCRQQSVVAFWGNSKASILPVGPPVPPYAAAVAGCNAHKTQELTD